MKRGTIKIKKKRKHKFFMLKFHANNTLKEKSFE